MREIHSSVGGEQLARVEARLRRGWIGVFVTTGHYSEAAQREVIEDRHPIMLVNGSQLADTAWAMMHERGTTEVSRIPRDNRRGLREED
jgi:hypothetical protein